MRTTVNLDADVAAEVERLRRERGLGLSEAVNELARAGAHAAGSSYHYQPPSYDMGTPRVDLTNVGEVLDSLDDWDRDQNKGRPRAS